MMQSNLDQWDENLFYYCLLTLYLIAPPTFMTLMFLQAPYGKHRRPGWGPTISSPLAWFLMESPTLWLTLLIFPLGINSSKLESQILILPFLFHYIHRTIIYPLRLSQTSRFPLSVALMAFAFNVLNAYLQARWVSHYKDFASDGFFWWRFLAGSVVFGFGMIANVRSDADLVKMKRGSGGGYVVPRRGWFELVSCANYFGEILEWLGWAVMTWSWVGFGFLLYTCANLVPRAMANHKWYLNRFGEDYPKGRKAVIPYLY